MSKKKGLSVEEKRTRMMDFFYEKKDFFQLKELEKLCQKEKGITSMSVKEILQGLVDDGMVDTDKIGTCVYFWAFPSKAGQNRKRKLEELSRHLEESQRKRKTAEQLIAKAKVGRESSEQRDQMLATVNKLQSDKKKLLEELDRHKDCDPEVMEQMKEDTVVAREAANRWTDNVFAVKTWVKNKLAVEEAVIDKQFDIPETFDYIE